MSVSIADILFSKMRRNSPLSDSDRGEFSPHFGNSIFWEDSRVASGGARVTACRSRATCRYRASPRHRAQAPDTHTARSVTARTLACSPARSLARATARPRPLIQRSSARGREPAPEIALAPAPARPPARLEKSAGTMLEVYATAQVQRPRFGNSVRIGFPF